MGKAFKFRRIRKDIAEVVASSSSLSAAARRLEVDRSTLHRWLKSGKVQRPATRAKRDTSVAVPEAVADQEPEAWAQSVQAEYELSPTEMQLLRLAVQALGMARDATLSAGERLSATNRFQMLAKQLRLEDADGEAAPRGDVRRWDPRRVG